MLHIYIYNVICNVEYMMHKRNNIRYNLNIFNLNNIVCMSIICIYIYISIYTNQPDWLYKTDHNTVTLLICRNKQY